VAQEPIIQILNENSAKSLMFRLVNNGIDFKVAENAIGQALKEKRWYPLLMDVGDMYRKLGDEALAENHRASAGEYFIKAALGYHFAQFLHFHDIPAKEHALKLKTAVHRQAHPLIGPPIRELSANFEGVKLPVQIRMPAGKGPHPAVVVVCGMDSSKEEYFYLQSYMLDRGLAMVGFDGPGQAEAWKDMKMRPDFHKAVSAVVDEVSKLPEIDASRWGLMGQSFGAFLGPSVLAHDKRFKAAVVNGGFFDLSHFDWANPIRQIGLPFLFGVETEAEAREITKQYTLANCIGEVRAPIMVIHGRMDRDAPPEAAKKIIDDSPGGGRFVEFPDGIHMCHNVSYQVKPMTADWLLDHLRAA
jgi:2,6-dihydroxypseudooxynicotine hydrolase